MYFSVYSFSVYNFSVYNFSVYSFSVYNFSVYNFNSVFASYFAVLRYLLLAQLALRLPD